MKIELREISIRDVVNGHRPHTRGLKFEYVDEK
jgi:hypothetical protein